MMVGNMKYIPNIDYKYWADRNPYFSDAPLITNIKTGLGYARKGNLIEDVIGKLENSEFSNGELVGLIEKEILEVVSPLEHPEGAILRIFDLIQGWGGKMGRWIYIKPKINPHRLAKSEFIAKKYSEGINFLYKNNIDKALSVLNKIPGLGDAFSTKHIHFWLRYGRLNINCSIYDIRIKTLLYFKPRRAPKYSEYLLDLERIAREKNISYHAVEAALFAFSLNWFSNSKLDVNLNTDNKTDLEEALSIGEQWKSER